MPLTEIPTVDLSTEDSAQVELVGQAFEDIGFVYVRDTFGVTERLYEMYRWMELLFIFLAEHPELRETYEREDLAWQRGYNPDGNEVGIFCRKVGPKVDGKHTSVPDHKEHWFIGHPTIGPDHPLAKRYPHSYLPNIWPNELELTGFRPAAEKMYWLLFEVGRVVLRAVAVCMGESPDYFEGKIIDGPSVMRTLHYLPFTQEDLDRLNGKQQWACGHTDINLVTVLPKSTPLPEAPDAGLWIKTKDGMWIRGMPPQGCIIVQVGDMLQRMTNKRFTSAVHEVRAPDRPTTKGRLSLAQFLHLHGHESVAPKNGSLPPMTAGEFLIQRLREIGVIKKEGGKPAPRSY